jgi:hypothetical protein
MIVAGVFLIFFIGVVHSYLGERYILTRLFRLENIPKLFGDDSFTKGTLRFVWHLLTIAWFGFGLILLWLDNGPAPENSILYIVASVFFIGALFSAGFTKGRHLSWVVFVTIAGLLMLAAE